MTDALRATQGELTAAIAGFEAQMAALRVDVPRAATQRKLITLVENAGVGG